jgi:hypothetical protein
MTISTHLNIAGMDLTVEIITHNPQFADYNVLNTHTGSPLGRVWEYDGRWRTKVHQDERFVEVEQVTDALEVLVRMARSETSMTTKANQSFDVAAAAEWVADGQWHKANGFLLALLMNTCPGMDDPFNEGLDPLNESVQVFAWEGHTPFAVQVRWVEVWHWYDGPVSFNTSTQENESSDGKTLRRRAESNIPRGVSPVRWESLEGKAPFVIGYRIETC